MKALSSPLSSKLQNSDIYVQKSQVFAVLEKCGNKEVNSPRLIDYYRLNGSTRNKSFVQRMNQFGCCVWDGIVEDEFRTNARRAVQPLVNQLIASYDDLDDEFIGIDQDDLNIVRMPRIGRGKHNIHFDPLLSKQHAAVAELAAAAKLAEKLSLYMGATCSLRESGISVTRPYNADLSLQSCSKKPIFSKYARANNTEVDVAAQTDDGELSEEEDIAAGEGMEWHSDGSAGEATVLMALEDVSPEQGALMVIPRSHHVYVDGVGHTEVSKRVKVNRTGASRCVRVHIPTHVLFSVLFDSLIEFRIKFIPRMRKQCF
jgi:hypothetical protein